MQVVVTELSRIHVHGVDASWHGSHDNITPALRLHNCQSRCRGVPAGAMGCMVIVRAFIRHASSCPRPWWGVVT